MLILQQTSTLRLSHCNLDFAAKTLVLIKAVNVHCLVYCNWLIVLWFIVKLCPFWTRRDWEWQTLGILPIAVQSLYLYLYLYLWVVRPAQSQDEDCIRGGRTRQQGNFWGTAGFLTNILQRSVTRALIKANLQNLQTRDLYWKHRAHVGDNNSI